MPTSKAPSTRVLFALGLVTAVSLAFQVAFTRLLSSVMAYHFSFLAISLALLGTGTGALLLYVRPGWFEKRSIEQNLSRWSALYALLLIATPFALVRLDYSLDAGVTLGYSLNLAAACVLAAAPALAAGTVVALAIRGYSEHVGRVYAWDLVAAGLGALVIVPLLWFPAPELLVGLGTVSGIAALLFAWPRPAERKAGGILTVAGVVVIVIATFSQVLYLPMGYGETGKVADVWSPLSRVQGFKQGKLALLFYDRVFAPVPYAADGHVPDWKELALGPQSIGYAITGPGRALVIGGGGGRDIWNALSSDQKVDVIELSSANRDVVDGPLGDVSGSPYSYPGVHTTIGDGRSILAQRDTKYDQIHIGFTDTLSASSAAGFALSENNLYTVEAFEQYLDHLTPDGILNVSRLEQLVGDEALRATVLTMAALEKKGVENPLDNMVVIRGGDPVGSKLFPYMTILARLKPFTPTEVAKIRTLARERGKGVAMAPGGPYYGNWDTLAHSKSWKSFCEGYHLNVCPPTDDKPFFFNMRRPLEFGNNSALYTYSVDPYVLLMVTLAILVGLSVVGLLLPLALSRNTERPGLPSLLYFGAIGLGFMFLESVLIQRFVLFLGFPTYALSVVLFSLLIFTGIGSAISSRLPHTRTTLAAALALAVGVIVIGSFALQPLLRTLIEQPFTIRVVLTAVLLAPMGILLGMPMPIGLSRFSARHPRSIAYAWGVNGIASVVGSVLGVAVAINWGYVVASLAGAACYAVALAHASFGRWSVEADRAEADLGDTDADATADAVTAPA